MNSDLLDTAARTVAAALPWAKPTCSIILGSGWGAVAEAFRPLQSMEYRDIPGLGAPGVEGHTGRLILAEHAGLQVLVFQGRRHRYEGAGWEPVALPVRLSLELGAGTLLLTNAAGGIHAALQPGSLMIIDDHINCMGDNPLVGNRDPLWGPRFADQTGVYDRGLRDLLDRAAAGAGLAPAHGIYAATSGPTYETPAEIRALRAMGADAVGMSTVPEAMLASAAGLKVAGISCITNRAAGTGAGRLSHREVIEAAAKAQPALRQLIAAFLGELAARS